MLLQQLLNLDLSSILSLSIPSRMLPSFYICMLEVNGMELSIPSRMLLNRGFQFHYNRIIYLSIPSRMLLRYDYHMKDFDFSFNSF